MHAKLAILSTVISLAGSAYAWGADGHQAVGFIADSLLKPETKAVRDFLLPSGWNFTRSATWADEIKSDPTFKWASNLHFIDSHDVTPLDANETNPVKCSVDLARDGENGVNVVDAIGNYTLRAADAAKYNWDARSEAVKFLSHFVGDITQPLHACGKLLGGNQFFTTWEGNQTYVYNGRTSKFQLHVLWDVYIPQKDVNENFGGNWVAYRQFLLDNIEKGEWAQEKDTWLQCNPTTSPTGNPDQCPLDWATDSNEFNCGVVWDKALLAGTGTSTANDLAGEYYQKTYPIVRKQIAKGGYRLAKFMDIILAGQPASNSTTTTSIATTTQSATATSGTTSSIATTTQPAEHTSCSTTSTITVTVDPTETATPSYPKPTTSPTPIYSAASPLKAVSSILFAVVAAAGVAIF
ncbi:uncharacterized protein SPPG_06496 [Spizellomyces punctatus DAOM BR117]|uniref:Phospholipase C/P1 nuclease n=1 Tax=Spizellomyces punctatus (strain DAOM BR117) TaxID=645134 RepID=A0A0L0H991_SPIPD|nr:uncharacterized protein SPPG_06496 [Spizellomyces punctatus DAOM BR117]KNC98085.1 hypothetical protein SPPG_06496 [Spizellomyces punctatus DAOM BR117]|eukprot:XP_016606125.1 hypothetical protein SPPG_06496 [Spizellomyces punctatus DAOM BR117]